MIQKGSEHSGVKVLTLEGDLSIDHARELRDRLLAELQYGSKVVLEIGESSGADLSFLQLLCSAHRTAARLGGSLELGDTVSREFLETAEGAGYSRQKCCPHSKDGTCLWSGRVRG